MPRERGGEVCLAVEIDYFLGKVSKMLLEMEDNICKPSKVCYIAITPLAKYTIGF